MTRVVGWLHVSVLFAVVVTSTAASADAKLKLRIATPAPDGTTLANAFHKFAHEVETNTNGDVEIKLYLGGIAGNEKEVYDLMKAGKLDGLLGAAVCSKVMPSMRVLDLAGVYENQDEATYVAQELRPIFDREAHEAGYALLGMGTVGRVIVFSQTPITNMAELRKAHMWLWDMKDDVQKQFNELKLKVVTTGLPDAQKAFDNKQTDGFLTTPVAALAFQWYSGIKYITDLRTTHLMGCMVLRESALDRLKPDDQTVVRRAAARLALKIDTDNMRIDEKLVGGTYEKLGIKVLRASKKFHDDFFDACRVVREQLGDALVPHLLLAKVTKLLADYRKTPKRT